MPISDQEEHINNAMKTGAQVTALVNQARAGNRSAFEQLVDLFHGDIFRMVYYRTRSRMDAEDITQEIFLNAFKSLSKLKKVEQFRIWLLRIGLNRISDFYRKKRVRAIFGAYSEDDNIYQSEVMNNILKQEFWKHIGLLLEKLSRMEREVFLLRFMDHLNIREISQVLKRSESAVKTHLYRALKKFRKEPELINLLKEETQ
jgi:RNA polymerase sigma-70 factor (ECF subfamily)